MRLSGQFRVYFFYKKILRVKKKHQNRKQMIFTLFEIFVLAKNCCLCCFLFAHFCFVTWFLLVTCLWRSKSFLKKKKNKQAQNCPDSLIYNTTFSYQKLTQTWSMPLITMYRAVVLQLLVNSKHRSSYCPTPIHLFWTYSELF